MADVLHFADGDFGFAIVGEMALKSFCSARWADGELTMDSPNLFLSP